MAYGPIEDTFLPSVAIHELESNTWPWLYTLDGGAGVTFSFIVVDDEGYVTAYELVAGNWYLVNLNQTVILTAGPAPLGGILSMLSATHKFLIVQNWGGGTTFGILRHGALAYAQNIVLDNADAALIVNRSISPNGKFIAFIVTSTATANWRYIMLYKGE